MAHLCQDVIQNAFKNKSSMRFLDLSEGWLQQNKVLQSFSNWTKLNLLLPNRNHCHFQRQASFSGGSEVEKKRTSEPKERDGGMLFAMQNLPATATVLCVKILV